MGLITGRTLQKTVLINWNRGHYNIYRRKCGEQKGKKKRKKECIRRGIDERGIKTCHWSFREGGETECGKIFEEIIW